MPAQTEQEKSPKKPHVVITCDGAKTKITIDGKDISSVVSGIEFVHSNGRKLPHLRLDLMNCEVSVSSYLWPEIPEEIMGLCKHLLTTQGDI